MPKEHIVDVGELPLTLIRSIKTVSNPVISETLGTLHGQQALYREPKTMQRVVNKAIDGKIDQETWPLIYFGYLVTRGGNIKAERLEPVRNGLNEYMRTNHEFVGRAMQEYMGDRASVLVSPTATIDDRKSSQPLASYADRMAARSKGPRPG